MSGALQELSNGLASAVEGMQQSIVRVEARRRLPASGFVWSEEGLIITANHVLRRDEDIRVGLPNGEVRDARMVGRDPSRDLALIRVEPAGLTVPALADPASLKVGHVVLALGRPGRTVQATVGIVSALSKDAWRTSRGGKIDRYLQTDVVMYPGFSGGPLLDVNGEVIGLNSSRLMRGLSLAIPVPTLKEVAEVLSEHGRIRHGYIGVSAQSVELPSELAESADQDAGLLLVSIERDGPAAQAGLLMGDTILSLAQKPVEDIEGLLNELSGDRIGEEVPVKAARGGEIKEFKLTVGERG